MPFLRIFSSRPGWQYDQKPDVARFLRREVHVIRTRYDAGGAVTHPTRFDRTWDRAKSIRSNMKTTEMHVCYEAGGCGMWIARRLAQLKVRCTVVAPSLIPSKAGDQVKTDKKDAIKLARLLRAGELVAV